MREEGSGRSGKKIYYRMAEVVEHTGIPAPTIRYWEKVGLIYPRRSRRNQRLFKWDDIQKILEIKRIKEDGFTIKGVKKEMKRNRNNSQGLTMNSKDMEPLELLKMIRSELEGFIEEAKSPGNE